MATRKEQHALAVAFADGRGVEVAFTAPVLTIGSDAACDLRLAASAAARHVELARHCNAVVLRVHADAPHVYVNARPVRATALLRAGDVIAVGADVLLLKQAGATVGTAVPLPTGYRDRAAAASLVGLRLVAGPLSGRRIAIDGGANLDAQRLPGVEGCVRLGPLADQVAFDYLPATGSAVAPEFNGVMARQGSLRQGDQLAWGVHRLVLEMPGSERLTSVRAAAPPVSGELRDRVVAPQREVWWLIATAALLALVMAILFVARNGLS
ncbi:MAG TPA: FHA domain-containing protein [Rhodanobacteraceae bacterium]|nr:FHA domain-containing protein [Rhodanobacteraceae bacterium]